MMRATTTTIPIAAMLLAALSVLPAAPADASSVSARRNGKLVLYLLLKELGYKVQRMGRIPAAAEPSGLDLIVALDEDDKRRIDKLAGWVAPGRRLLLAPAVIYEDKICGDVQLGKIKIKRSVGSAEVRARDPALKFESHFCQIKPPSGARILVGACGLGTVVELDVGDGKVLVLSSGSLLDNSRIDDDDTIVVVRRWLQQTVPPPAQAAFLEKRTGQFWQMLRKANMLPVALHGLLWLLVLYWVVTPRFGESSPVPSSNRREFAQHAKALGRLYLAANASAHVLRRQYERFVSRLFGGGGGTDSSRRRRGPGAGGGGTAQAEQRSRAALASLVATRTGRDPRQIETLLGRLEEAATATDVRSASQEHYRLSQALAELQHSSARARGRRKHGAASSSRAIAGKEK